MIYLLLALTSSASIALLFKITEGKKLNRLAVTGFNYLSGWGMSLLFFRDWPLLFSQWPPSPEIQWAGTVGIPAGFLFFYAFIFYQKSVRENGAALSGMTGKLGILLPMILSMILWAQFPTALQWAGIVLALGAIILAYIPENASSEKGFAAPGAVHIAPGDKVKKSILETIKQGSFSIPALFLLMGGAEFSNKVFQQYAPSRLGPLFLGVVFLSAGTISMVYLSLRKWENVQKEAVLFGLLVGIPNFFSSYFLIRALDFVISAVAFPVFAVGSILIITAAELFFFRGTFSRRKVLVLLLAVTALVLLNLP